MTGKKLENKGGNKEMSKRSETSRKMFCSLLVEGYSYRVQGAWRNIKCCTLPFGDQACPFKSVRLSDVRGKVLLIKNQEKGVLAKGVSVESSVIAKATKSSHMI